MILFNFLKQETDRPLHKLVLMAGVSGLSSMAVLAIINLAAQESDPGSINISYILMFVAAVGIFITSQKFILVEGITIIEGILREVRDRISQKIRKTELLNIEIIGKAEIYNRMTQEMSLISQMAVFMIQGVQAIVLLIFIVGYVAYLSLMAVILLIVLVSVGFYVIQKNDKIIVSKLRDTNIAEIRFFSALTDIIDGLKELKLHRKKSADLATHYQDISSTVHELKITSGQLFSNNMVFSTSFTYFLLGAIVFVLPQLKESFSEDIISTTTAMLFAVGPLSSIIYAFSSFEKVNMAIGNIYKLESELDEHLNPNESQPPQPVNQFTGFHKIDLTRLYFAYTNGGNGDAFKVGPIDLSIKRGERLFIVGGNGSGKTTFLKAMTLLYKPQSGSIHIDDTLVDDNNYLDYRDLFSAIFYDFHLFDKLYGLENIDPRIVADMLKLMEIDQKTGFVDNGFTKLNLSTGQRKRLALIAALLEDKPIFIFDEWAADQDPLFKDYFYNDLLKQLKEKGKTVIAVSHDDRYFHLADRVIKLDYGKVIKDEIHTPKGNKPTTL